MPELPEVETIRLQLEKYLVGHRILAVEALVSKIFPSGKEKLIAARIKTLRRFGKVLVIDLDNGYSFLVHLKLTGQLIYQGSHLPNKPNKFTRVIFVLDKNSKLLFNDSRKLGWIKVEKTEEVEKESFIRRLGPEPLRNLTLTKFSQIVSSSRRPIKILLMDQAKLSGVGNIYANDTLWLARISPQRPANSLKPTEARQLYLAINKVLKTGLKYQGASDQWYLTAEGKKGSYQDHFLVYNREDEPCEHCHKQKIKKVFLSGRGTYFCPTCQR